MKLTRRDVLCSMCLGAIACDEPAPGGPRPDTDTDVDTDPDVLIDTDLPWSPCVEPGAAADGWVPVAFADNPGLDQLLGFAYLQLDGRQVVIAHVEPDCYVALERPCTHEGVPIEYRPDRNGFVCPRHGAVYAWDGRVMSGPPPRDVASFPCGPRDGAVWVKIG